ncbi:MAG TPA: hypothetical protein VEY33_05000 [Gemmatimonadota bacterium]|nr:hypothetical protein [Gemmatimonadota bacterium]
MLDDRVSRAALAISLLLHGALVAPMWKRWSPLAGDSAAATAPLDEPMVFHLVDPQDGLDAKPDVTTPNVSDANRRAAQPDAPEDLPLGEAFHAGQSPVPSTPRPAGARSAPAATAPREESGEGRTDPRLALGPTRIGVRPTAPASPGDRLPAPEVDQRLTRAEAGSAFTLNTTAWEWAPYMQRLKARIEQHISPPMAFYYGTAAWISRVRFRIGPDGRLLEFRLLDHRGVENLQYVALDAITRAADYEPLPPGFPEPYLEITGNFYFNVFPSDGP